MSQRPWWEYVYESFMLRDLIGYAAPGSILVAGLLCELGKIAFLKSLLLSWSGIAVLIAASYVAATGLRLLGTSLRLVLFHRQWGFFGRGWLANADQECPCDTCKLDIERLLWRGDEERMRRSYTERFGHISKADFDAVQNREGVFMHLTGLAGMAFLALSVAIYLLPQDGFFQILNHTSIGQVSLLHYLNLTPRKDEIIALTFVMIGIVFILGHYRHTHQAQMLRATRPK